MAIAKHIRIAIILPKIESIWIRHVVARGGKNRRAQRFHLEGISFQKEILAFGRKFGRK